MHTTAMQTFNSKVRELIDCKGLTITQLADQIGMTREALSKILNGRVDPTSSTLERIASGLQVQLWELLRPESTNARRGKVEKVA